MDDDGAVIQKNIVKLCSFLEYTLDGKEPSMPLKWLPGNVVHLKVIS